MAALSAEVKVCVRMCERVLLAALRAIATDPKVTDHPNCVFTHFIIRHHTDQQWPDCSYRAEGLDEDQYTMFLPSPCQIAPSWPGHTVLSSLWFLSPSCEDQTSFPMCEEGLQQSCFSSSTVS